MPYHTITIQYLSTIPNKALSWFAFSFGLQAFCTGWVGDDSYISYQIHLSSRACNSTWSTMYKVKPWMDLLVSPCSVFQTLARGPLVFVIVVCYSWFSLPATSKDASQYLRLTIRSSIFCICRGFCSKMGGRRWSFQLVVITQAVLQLEEAR